MPRRLSPSPRKASDCSATERTFFANDVLRSICYCSFLRLAHLVMSQSHFIPQKIYTAHPHTINRISTEVIHISTFSIHILYGIICSPPYIWLGWGRIHRLLISFLLVRILLTLGRFRVRLQWYRWRCQYVLHSYKSSSVPPHLSIYNLSTSHLIKTKKNRKVMPSLSCG